MVFSPLYLVVMNWVFSLRFRSYRIEYFYGFESTWYVLHMNTHGDNGVLYWLTWCLFWNSTRGFPRWHWGNLCIGVDARSCLCFSGRNLGELFEVICVGLNITNLNLLWCYFSMNSWLDRSGRIAWCYFSTNSRIDRTKRIALCYFSTNSWIDRTKRIALRWFRTLQTIYSYVLR